MMWRQCVVLLVLFAWQVSSSTSELVNLIERQVDFRAPRSDFTFIGIRSRYSEDLWRLVDNNIDTFEEEFRFRLEFQNEIRATRVRITLPPDWRERAFPTEWTIEGTTFVVTQTAVEDGVIEFDIASPMETKSYRIETRRNGGTQWVAIAEIELLGTRADLDALWPYGAYPCSQRLEMITPLRGPKGRLFAKANNAVSKRELRPVFKSDWAAKENNLPDFEYRGVDPVVIGVEFAEIPTVHAIMVHGNRFYVRQGIERMVLEGHDCETFCSKAGPKGWVTLENRRMEKDYRTQDKFTPDPFYLATPGQYKAYRIKFYPTLRQNGVEPKISSMTIQSIFFLGCKAD